MVYTFNTFYADSLVIYILMQFLTIIIIIFIYYIIHITVWCYTIIVGIIYTNI